MRPAVKARKSIVKRTGEIAARSLSGMKTAKAASEFDEKISMPKTLVKISGMAKGWARHYYFCNDLQTIHDVDMKIYQIFCEYTIRAQRIASSKNGDLGAACMGYQGAREIKYVPLMKPAST